MRHLYLIALLVVVGCSTNEQEPPPIKGKELKDGLVKANKVLHENEEEDIEHYIKRAGWDMTTTPTGLRYQIYESGSGPVGQEGQMAKIRYEVKLLTGKVCYSSVESGDEHIEIGKSEVSGLNEAMLKLRKGDRAKIILPSHLAYGLVGDENCIPRKATVIYDVQIIEIINTSNQ